MLTGFVQSRRGLLEHLADARLTPLEYAAFCAIRDSADPSTGIWYGGSRALSVLFGGGISERAARRLLEGLENKGYLGRFVTPGSHVSYAIAINKYMVTVGARTGTRLMIDGVKVITDLHYVGGEDTGEDVTPFKERELRIENKQQALAFDGQVLKITARQNRAFAKAFPNFDLQEQYGRMDSWLLAHPEKHYKKFGAFAHGWLTRERPWFAKQPEKAEPKPLNFAPPQVSPEGQAIYDRFRKQDG